MIYSDYHDQVPYSMVGTATTLPGRKKRTANPIGFIWPKREKLPAKPKQKK